MGLRGLGFGVFRPETTSKERKRILFLSCFCIRLIGKSKRQKPSFNQHSVQVSDLWKSNHGQNNHSKQRGMQAECGLPGDPGRRVKSPVATLSAKHGVACTILCPALGYSRLFSSGGDSRARPFPPIIAAHAL